MAIHKIPSDLTIRSLKPGCPGRLSDGNGLYLLTFLSEGRHHWRFDYSFEGKRRTLSLGVYPDTTLARAREVTQEYRQLVASGQDPSALRKQRKRQIADLAEAQRRIRAGEPALRSFEEVGRRWYALRAADWMPSYAEKVLGRLEKYAYPRIGHLPIGDVEPPQLLDMCRRVEANGAIETAGRVLELSSLIFRFAVAEGLIKSDPARDIRGALKKPASKHFAAIIKPAPLGQLLRDIDNYSGTFIVRCALQLTPMLMVRPSELRLAKWEEFDLDNGLWYVPSERMKRTKEQKKKGKPHLVPLARQAIAILNELFELTGRTGMVFPAEGRTGRHMSENTVNTALRSMGYSTQEQVTSHGFRATARTMLVENLDVPEAIVEMQLAHAVRDMNGTAYNRTEFNEQRTDMMQRWADYLDSVKAGRNLKSAGLPEFVPVTNRLKADPRRGPIRALASLDQP